MVCLVILRDKIVLSQFFYLKYSLNHKIANRIITKKNYNEKKNVCQGLFPCDSHFILFLTLSGLKRDFVILMVQLGKLKCLKKQLHSNKKIYTHIKNLFSIKLFSKITSIGNRGLKTKPISQTYVHLPMKIKTV